MLVSLYSAATGMNAEQRKLDIISNNLANVDTTGYKSRGQNFRIFFIHLLRNRVPLLHKDLYYPQDCMWVMVPDCLQQQESLH